MKNMFLGIIIITIGLLVLLNSIFGFNLPVIKILFGIALIYWGLKVLFGSFELTQKIEMQKRATDREAIFAESEFSLREQNKDEYVTVFGSSTMDLSDLTEVPKDEIEYVVVMGRSKLILPKSIPAIVYTQSVMSNTDFKEGQKNVVGSIAFKNSLYKEGEPALVVQAKVVFGDLRIIEAK
ncbi:MAG: hypothetical protein ACLGGX_00005 [Bdellovibrionia bacterium]